MNKKKRVIYGGHYLLDQTLSFYRFSFLNKVEDSYKNVPTTVVT